MKFVLYLICTGVLISCGSSNLFRLSINNKGKIHYNDTLKISVVNRKEKKIDSIICFFQNKQTSSSSSNNKIEIPLTDIKLGRHIITATVFYEGKKDSTNKEIIIYAEAPPKLYTYKIIKEYPRKEMSYTQGLEFYNDTLYESTGLYKKSTLRKVDFRTGNIYKQIKLNDGYFGEGITIINDTIYQLSWRENVGFLYTTDLNKISNFSYGQSKKGWGICNDGSNIYKSDGSEKIWILERKTLKEKSFIQLCSDKTIFSKANELEWVDNQIFANTYLKDGIMIIDPKTGALTGVVDFRGLKDKVTQYQDLDVLNGIAYHPKRKTFFVTGKNWDKLFEIEILLKE